MLDSVAMKETLAILASALAIYANWSYMSDVLKEKVKPHPYTWAIWSIVSGVIFFGQLIKGAGWGVVPTFFAEIFTILIFIFSLKHGFKKVRPVDHLFLFIAILGLIPWYMTKDPTVSVVIVTLVDLIAFMPTVAKTWTKPRSENPYFYEMNTVRHIFSLLSLQSYNIATMFHSCVMVFANLMIPIELKLRRNKSFRRFIQK